VLCNALIHLDERLQDWFDLTASQDAFRHGVEQVVSVFLAVNADEVCQGAQFASLDNGQRLLVLQVVQGQEYHLEPFLNGLKGLQAEVTQAQG
jgi:hypothetical protein